MLFHELPEAEYLEGVKTEAAVGILAANANQQHYSRRYISCPVYISVYISVS